MMTADNARTRRSFLRRLAQLSAATAGLGLLASCVPPATTPAQTATRVYRIGLVAPRPQDTGRVEDVFAPFLERLGELGYIQGQNLAVEPRSVLVPPPGADQDAFVAPNRGAVDELVGLPVDLLAARSRPGILSAMAATSSIPIVMVTSADPVAESYVASLARPGGNVTGVMDSPPEMNLKRLQLLAEAVPGAARVAVLGNPRDPEFWETATQTLGIELITEPVTAGGG
jgi:putative ABC transport system substrate-binding protein